jgi:ubiquitin-like protein Pup
VSVFGLLDGGRGVGYCTFIGGVPLPGGAPMEKQERRPESRKDAQTKEEVKPNPKVVESGKKMKEDIDKLIDEIDDVLEENAEEFVKNYVQKGGE